VKLQPLDFSADIVFVEHLPIDYFPENNKLYTADKDSSIHHLELYLLGLEEFDTTKYGQSYKNRGVYAVGNQAGEHFSAVELPYHRQ
jgi:hypothetical protein